MLRVIAAFSVGLVLGLSGVASASYVLKNQWTTMAHPFRQGYALGVADAVEAVSGWYVFDRKDFDASLRAAFVCVQSTATVGDMERLVDTAVRSEPNPGATVASTIMATLVQCPH